MPILPPRDLHSLRHADLITNIQDQMDNLKAATGLSNSSSSNSSSSSTDTSSTKKSGQEPVSGRQGSGTASEPFDLGNAEGNDGAPAKEGGSGALDDAKRKAEELIGKGS